MEVIALREYQRLFALGSTVTALGFFDGVHLGHQELIDYTVARAKELGISSAVLTFAEDMRLVKPSSPRITDQETRLALLEKRCVDYIILANFADIKGMGPMEFVKNVLIGLCHVKEAVCGFNYRFGKDRAGDATTLTQHLKLFGATTHIMPPTTAPDGVIISSTSIREAIMRGDVESAAIYLGSPYTLTANVVHGREIGRTIGTPTINQQFPPYLVVPKCGVYATQCRIGDKTYTAVTNVGTRPTVGGSSLTCETHVLGYSGSLYGQTVTLSFLAFIREETHFASLEQLQNQIQEDIRKVVTLYGNH